MTPAEIANRLAEVERVIAERPGFCDGNLIAFASLAALVRAERRAESRMLDAQDAGVEYLGAGRASLAARRAVDDAVATGFGDVAVQAQWRLERGIAQLGADKEPPVGWEAGVLRAVSAAPAERPSWWRRAWRWLSWR